MIPFRKQLETLIDVRRSYPAYDTSAMNGPVRADYWTRTLYWSTAYATYYWNTMFDVGSNEASDGTLNKVFRCVAGP